ncbi:MAG: SPFH domain-containing protein [bacterium]
MALIDRVKYDGPGDVFVWRWASDQLSWGTQVIVNQAQEVLFFKGGKILDTLGPGTHTLKTANIPLLRNLVNIPFGNETPFAAEIYYINKAVNMDLKWGTREPIPILEPAYQIFVPVRAFGQFGMKVNDSQKLVVGMVGTMTEFTAQNILDYFRGVLMSKIKDYISEKIINDKISILTISTELNEISKALKESVSGEFANFGIEIVNFYLSSINVPEEDESVKKLKKMLAEKAEYKLMGDQLYKTKRTFDTMEGAAKNEGAAGGMMGAGMGAGMGMGMGAGFGQMANQMMGNAQQQNQQAGNQGIVCPHCNTAVPIGSKFCSNCGKTVEKPKIKCANCDTEIEGNSKFCSNCGNKVKIESVKCGKCNVEVAQGSKFCPNCGDKIS